MNPHHYYQPIFQFDRGVNISIDCNNLISYSTLEISDVRCSNLGYGSSTGFIILNYDGVDFFNYDDAKIENIIKGSFVQVCPGLLGHEKEIFLLTSKGKVQVYHTVQNHASYLDGCLGYSIPSNIKIIQMVTDCRSIFLLDGEKHLHLVQFRSLHSTRLVMFHIPIFKVDSDEELRIDFIIHSRDSGYDPLFVSQGSIYELPQILARSISLAQIMVKSVFTDGAILRGCGYGAYVCVIRQNKNVLILTRQDVIVLCEILNSDDIVYTTFDEDRVYLVDSQGYLYYVSLLSVEKYEVMIPIHLNQPLLTVEQAFPQLYSISRVKAAR